MENRSDSRTRQGARAAVAEGRRIQDRIDRKTAGAKAKSKERTKPVQAGERAYPGRFPAQHLEKPGLERDLKFAPMYEAPAYRGSDKGTPDNK